MCPALPLPPPAGWPPVIAAGDQWATLYVEAAEGLDVIPDVEEAVIWANELIRRITISID